MGKKVEQVQRPTSPAGPADRVGAEDGFTLLEVVCVVAIISLVAAIILPAIGLRMPLTTLWANLHSSYIFGLGLAALLAGEPMLAAPDRRASLGVLRGWASSSDYRSPR